jgi:aspartyl-tRNA(Asn)/glutamyl-tRNA(Gln) amidotransferase subunit B
MLGEVIRVLKETNSSITEFPIPAVELASLINSTLDKTISGSSGKDVFNALVADPDKTAQQIIEEKNLAQISDETTLRVEALAVINKNQPQYDQYKGGKEQLFGFFVGAMMKATRGRANPKVTQKILRELLSAAQLPEA